MSLATEAISWTGVLFFHTNMNIAPNIFRLFNLPLVVLLYRKQTTWRNRDKFAYILIVGFELLALTNLFFLQGLHTINSYTSSLASFCIVLMSMTYLFGHDYQWSTESRTRLPMYWINIALLFYYCTTFFINLWVDYLVNVAQSNLIAIWMVHNGLGVIFYGILCYALMLIRKTNNSQSHN